MILAASQFVPATATQVFSNATAGEVLIDYFVARNNDTAQQTLSVWMVPSGGVNDNSNLRTVVTIAPGQSYIFTEIVGDVLAGYDSLWLMASTVSTIAVKVSGRQR